MVKIAVVSRDTLDSISNEQYLLPTSRYEGASDVNIVSLDTRPVSVKQTCRSEPDAVLAGLAESQERSMTVEYFDTCGRQLISAHLRKQ